MFLLRTRSSQIAALMLLQIGFYLPVGTAMAITVEELDAQLESIESEQSSQMRSQPASQPASQATVPGSSFVPSSNNPIQNATSGVGDSARRITGGIDSSIQRASDQVNGRINGTIGRVQEGINRKINDILSGVLDPINGSIDGVLEDVNRVIDETLSDVLDPITGQIDSVLEDIFGSVDGIFDETIDDVFGESVFGGIFGNRGSGRVEPVYDPMTAASAETTAEAFSRLLPDLTEPFTNTVPIDSGAMGLPDYGRIREDVLALATADSERGTPNPQIQGADRFSNNPEVLTNSLANEIERDGARSLAEATLSKEGQDAMLKEKEGAKETLGTIVELADGAQDKDVTQDIMKDLTAMSAQAAVLNTGSYRQQMEIRQQLATSGILLSNVSEALDEEQRAQRSDQLGRARQMQLSSSLFMMPGQGE